MRRFDYLNLTSMIGILLAWNMQVQAQRDTSLLLRPEQLTEKDIKIFGAELKGEVITSATGLSESPFETPFSNWVITSEDILRYGFVTLADVLKAAPGIRVSQPGNAMEGETFMMRGLTGNQYVKILINDVPVKPGMALGMPLAAQLPVRQAERIEVIYGAAAGVLYGNEACAGIVNIITKETERPVFTQADLSFGSLGYNSLDLTFGGKLFKDRNILRFTAYGGSTVRSNTDIFWDTTLFNLDQYLIRGMTSDHYGLYNNFVSNGEGFPTQTRRSPISHESRLFGLQLNWRGMKFSYHRMSRSDASALGMSPLAVSYAATGDLFRDKIDAYTLEYNFKHRLIQVNTYVSVEDYRILNSSSTHYIFDRVAAQDYLGADGPDFSQTDRNNLLMDNYFRYNFQQRYAFSRQLDGRFHFAPKFRLNKSLWFSTGLDIQATLGTPYVTHLIFPVERAIVDSTIRGAGPFPVEFQSGITSNLFADIVWKSGRWQLVAGAGHNIGYGLYNYRGAIFYHLDSESGVFGNIATGTKVLHFHHEQNTFQLPPWGVNATVYPATADLTLAPERFQSIELGYRANKSELTLFMQEAGRLARDGYSVVTPLGLTSGYFSGPSRSLRLWGAQLRLVAENTDIVSDKRREMKKVTWRGEFFAQYTRGQEWFGFGIAPTDAVRNMPRWITQFRSSGRTGPVQVTVSSNRQTEVLSKAVPFSALWQRNSIRETYPVFRTWDVMLRFYLSKNFVTYSYITNVFNRKSYGLDASGGPDDLLMPVQQRRIFRIGINYNMN